MSASLGLYRLQQVDRQIDQVQAQLQTIRVTLENDNQLRQALALVESAGSEQHQARHSLQLAEAEVQSQKIKIDQAEVNLYGGHVHNPKELQDLQNDVVSLKRHFTTLEERQLEAMLKTEQADNKLKQAQADLEMLQSRLGDEHQKLISEQVTLTKNLDRLREEREAAVNPLGSSYLEKYEDLREKRRGLAVTEITDNACSACGTTLTAAIQQTARSMTQIVTCPSCSRILYMA
jgi:predicted  nucleic acid-binding Zn-ribbon protein